MTSKEVTTSSFEELTLLGIDPGYAEALRTVLMGLHSFIVTISFDNIQTTSLLPMTGDKFQN